MLSTKTSLLALKPRTANAPYAFPPSAEPMVNPGTDRARSRRSRAPLSSMTSLGYGRDGSRRIGKRLVQLARSRLLDLVGRFLVGIGIGAFLFGRELRRRGLGLRSRRGFGFCSAFGADFPSTVTSGSVPWLVVVWASAAGLAVSRRTAVREARAGRSLQTPIDVSRHTAGRLTGLRSNPGTRTELMIPSRTRMIHWLTQKNALAGCPRTPRGMLNAKISPVDLTPL